MTGIGAPLNKPLTLPQIDLLLRRLASDARAVGDIRRGLGASTSAIAPSPCQRALVRPTSRFRTDVNEGTSALASRS